MNLEQTSELLIVASAYDHRKLTGETITAWHDALKDLEYEYALEAVKMHFKISTEYLMPKHVRGNAKTIANDQKARDIPMLEKRATGQPTCRHGDKLTKCETCCTQLMLIDGTQCQHEYNAINCTTCTERIYK
jgi:hypothetical protein